MTVIPFICLGIGIVLGLTCGKAKLLQLADRVSTIALVLLMLTIGVGIGGDEEIIKRFPEIGFNCVIIACMSILCSVACTYICEKTVLPLKKLDAEVQEVVTSRQDEDASAGSGHLVWIMPGSIALGMALGFFLRNRITAGALDGLLTVFLVVLYICVGVSQGAAKGITAYIKKLGIRILILPMAILAGSLMGGAVSALLLDVEPEAAVLSAGGMSFYSITGAYMTQAYGIEIGTYGFIVNVLRETFTVLLLPLLIRLSPGSAIAGGAAGDMDTMLAPITKFVGPRLGFVTLATGTILTLIVPFLLPILGRLVG